MKTMYKDFTLSVVVVLLMSSGALAAVGQAEGFSIGALNMVQRVGRAGWAEGGNLVMVGHSQKAYFVGAAAMQKETGILIQNASVCGACGITKVRQNASVDGRQHQIVRSGRGGFQTQGQSLNVSLDDVIRQTGTIGGADGAQSFVGGQNQILVTPGGTSANSQFVGAAQFAEVSGGRNTNVVINNSLDIKMDQNQIVKGTYMPPKPQCYP
jgi:hypothetical protein